MEHLHSSTYTTNDVNLGISLLILIKVFHLAIELIISSLEDPSIGTGVGEQESVNAEEMKAI
jgi:hypothetical protein